MIRSMAVVALACAVLAAPAESESVEEIIVTASRFEELARFAGASVSVVSAEDAADAYYQHPAEVVNLVPGAFLNQNSGQEGLPALRSPVLTGGEGAGAFLLLEDGIALRATAFANVNGLMDATFLGGERVEVLRGPGTAIYGSNALHGVIDVRSPQLTGERETTAALTLGPRERARLSLSHEEPLARGALRVAAVRYQEDGWREEAGVSRHEARLQTLQERGSLTIETALTLLDLEQETAGYVRGAGAYLDETLARSNPNPEAFRDLRALRGHVRLSGIAANGDAWQVTPYARLVDQRFPLHFLPVSALEETSHHSIGIQTAWQRRIDERFSLQAGVDGEWTQGALSEFQEAPTRFSFVQGAHYDYEVTTAIAALYGRARWTPAPDWTLTGGLRVEAGQYDYENALPANVVGRYRRPESRTDSFHLLNPEAAVTRRWNERHTSFMRLARGARMPLASELYSLQAGQDEAAPDPQTILSLEAGWRYGGAVIRTEVIGYVMEKENGFFRDADGVNVTDARTLHRGVEASLDWDISPQWTLAGAVSVARHEYGFDRPVGSGDESVRKGDRVDGAPHWLAQAGLRYSPGGKWVLGADLTHVGDYPTNAANTASYGGHTLLDAMAHWDVTDAVRLTVRVHNVTDEAYASRADFAFGADRYFPGEPRSASLRLSWRR